MSSTSNHEAHQSSRQNAVEHHLPPLSIGLGADLTPTGKSLPSFPRRMESIHSQEPGDVVEIYHPLSTIPDSELTSTGKRTRSLVVLPSPDSESTSAPSSPGTMESDRYQANTVESYQTPVSGPTMRWGKRRASIVTIPNFFPTSMLTSPHSVHFKKTERRMAGVTAVMRSQQSVPRRPDHAKLVKHGFQSLAVMCTFVAAVQAQLLQMTYAQTDKASQIINAFFFTGLFVDIAAAILSTSSARWFEMLTPEEINHWDDWLFVSTREASSAVNYEEDQGRKMSEGKARHFAAASGSIHLEAQTKNRHKRRHFVIERWLSVGLKSGLWVAYLGLGFLGAGVMVYVWSHTSMIVQVMSTISCIILVLLLPPFSLPHDRKETLKHVRLPRYSDLTLF